MKHNLHIAQKVSLLALLLTQSLMGVAMPIKSVLLPLKQAIKPTTMQEAHIEILSDLYKKISFGIRTKRSTMPQEWMNAHHLNIDRTNACYNAGNIQVNKEQPYIAQLESIGFLSKCNFVRKDGKTMYKSFGVHSIIFPLKDCNHKIVNLFAIGINVKKTNYLNEEGIYPYFPKAETTKLYIVPTIMDAATLLDSKILKAKESVIALFDGKIMPQHEEAIKMLKSLQEIIWVETTKI